MNGVNYIFINIGCEFTKDSFYEENVVYNCDNEKTITLRCPCGCNDLIILNTIKDTKPCWSIQNNNTITPSINRIVGCKSHFTITNGIVKKH